MEEKTPIKEKEKERIKEEETEKEKKLKNEKLKEKVVDDEMRRGKGEEAGVHGGFLGGDEMGVGNGHVNVKG